MGPGLLLLFGVLFILSAFFSASEIALMSVSPHKIQSFLRSNKPGAKSLEFIKQRNDRLLISILILNNLVNLYAAAFATKVAIDIASTSSLEQGIAVGLATAIVTFCIILLGEIIPKSYATKNIDSFSLLVAYFYKIILILFTPLLIIIEFITKITTGDKKMTQMTDEEIESFIDMGKENGVFEESEHKKIKNMLEFSDITVESIYTPRIKIDLLPITTTIEEALHFTLKTTHSRIPLYGKTIDQIEYVVNLRFLIQEYFAGNGNKTFAQIKGLDKAIKVPLNHPIDKLLDIFQRSHKHLAIVLDEYGGVAGLVTLEDIVEEVFGEIRDEYDEEKDEIREIGPDKYEVDSSILLEELFDELELNFEVLGLDEKEYFATTLNYFITEELERFPHPGEVLEKALLGIEGDDSQRYIVFTIGNVVDSKIESIQIEFITKALEG